MCFNLLTHGSDKVQVSFNRSDIMTQKLIVISLVCGMFANLKHSGYNYYMYMHKCESLCLNYAISNYGIKIYSMPIYNCEWLSVHISHSWASHKLFKMIVLQCTYRWIQLDHHLKWIHNFTPICHNGVKDITMYSFPIY